MAATFGQFPATFRFSGALVVQCLVQVLDDDSCVPRLPVLQTYNLLYSTAL